MKKALLILITFFLSNIIIAQTTAIPDANFEQALINLGYDIGFPDGMVLTANIDTLTSLFVGNMNIIDLTGIEDFTSLTYLSCSNNPLTNLDLTQNSALTELVCIDNQLTTLDVTQNINLDILQCDFSYNLSVLDVTQNSVLTILSFSASGITTIDVTQNTALTYLGCGYSQLTTIDVTQNPALTYLDCGLNQISTIDVTQNTALTGLNCRFSQLTSIDVTQNIALTQLICNDNQLTTLDVTQNTALTGLVCGFNQLTTLDITQNPALTYLECNDNQLTDIDVTQHTALTGLYCHDNQLTYLNVKNGNNTSLSLDATNNPDLACIEVDSVAYSAANWTTIDPGTSFSTNCCPGLSLNVDSVNNITCLDSGKVFVSANGGTTPYSYTWVTTPPLYDSILTTDSTKLYVVHVSDSNNCMLSKGVLIEGPKEKNAFDLNTSLSSSNFRPGLLSNLNLSAWNDGCVLASGQLSISYSGPITYTNSSISPNSNNSNTLTWNFANWDYFTPQFLSSLEFIVDTAANSGDLVCFDISITPIIGDADTSNNLKTYCFDVVNSYDPNDKQVYPKGVCAENYVLKNEPLTYTVRFQNTGTAPAIDIYILDSLSNSFNINTLHVISKSHEPLITDIIGNRIVRFRFDNINLPDSISDEQGSHGYVTYEIYPKGWLNNGTVIENSAAIYFDFNPPIFTNTTTNTLTSVLPTTITTIMNESSATSFTLNNQTYTETGTYNQYFYASDGCDSIVEINLSIVTSVPENYFTNFLIYPNPTSNKLTIATELEINEIDIVDIAGKIIMTTKQKTKQVDVTNLPKGIYFIKIITDKRTITKKFVKH